MNSNPGREAFNIGPPTCLDEGHDDQQNGWAA